MVARETPSDLTSLPALHADLLRREETEGVEQPLDLVLSLAGQAQGEAQVPGPEVAQAAVGNAGTGGL